VLLNVCSHRGVAVCRTDCGNASTFRCPYHGWSYDNTGRLLGVTVEREAFGGRINKAELGLKEARVATYHGLIFATWNADGPSLEDRLGDMRFYYDMVFGLTDNGLEVAGPPIRWVERANWKFASDNLVGDGYHTLTVHKSFDELGLVPGFNDPSLFRGLTSVADPKNGDGMEIVHFFPLDPDDPEALEQATFLMGLDEGFAEEVKRHLTPEQMPVFLRGMPGIGNIFPNMCFFGMLWPTGDPDEGLSYMPAIRLAQPNGPNEHVVWEWALVPKDMPEEAKILQRRASLRNFGSSGIAEQDDAEIWATAQRATRGVQGRKRVFRYLAEGPKDETWPGPGNVRTSFPDEVNQLNFWARWRDLMASH
jgi:hypothetical protein